MADKHPSVGGIPLVFGGNVFSWTIDRDKSFEVLDAFYEAGGRMIDTAEAYGQHGSGERGQGSELILGEWLETRGVRKEMLIGTKTGLGGPGTLTPARVSAALDASLERLRTDYVDLYYSHKDDEETPLEDTVAAFDAAYKSGKAKELGGSNYSADRFQAILDTAEKMGAQPFTIMQPNYSLAIRDQYEGPLQDLCVARDIGVFPYFSLASGFLTGKYRSPDDWADSGRKFALDMIIADTGWQVLSVLDEVVAESGASHVMVSLAWLKVQPGIIAPLASASSAEQVGELVKAASFELSEDQIARLNASNKS